ncbi:MAG: AzlD domain-containing protein [Coriobacteriia bacterium]|nr:AzlD domain-containing protein [Coriobacteriia bacterium]
MSDRFIWSVVIGMALANFLVRFIPIAIVSRVELPGPIMRWLSFIPASVMGALVAAEVFRPGGSWIDPVHSPYGWAALLTGLVYWRSRSFLGATLAGMLGFVALRAWLG